MDQEKGYTLKRYASAFSVIFSVVLISYIDQYIYDFHTVVAAILAGVLSLVLSMVFKQFSFFEKKITKKTEITLAILGFFLLFFSFYFFQL